MWMRTLKHKVIEEYKKLIASMNVGKQMNYDHILDMICFIEVNCHLDQPEFIKEHLLYHG